LLNSAKKRVQETNVKYAEAQKSFSRAFK